MSKTELKYRYRCWNDCVMQGCPSHEATLKFQSVSNSLWFSDGKGAEIYMQTPELEALLGMLHTLSKSRVEISSAIKTTFGGEQVRPS